MFEEISEKLKQARLKNNITIEQLSAKTRIDVKFIEAMEIGDFAFLPELYVKAFIKQYSKAVDLDEDLIIKQYEAAKSGIPFQENESENIREITSNKPEENKEKKIIEDPQMQPIHTFDAVGYSKSKVKDSFLSEKNRLMFGGIIVAVVFIFAFVYFFFIKKTDDIVIPEKSIEEIIQENKDRYTANPDDSAKPVSGKAISDSLMLTIKASDTSWVKIILDDKRSDEFILFPKSQKVIAAGNNFKITFGNSGGIDLILNNKSLNFVGRDKGVKYVLINKDGLKYLQNPPSL